MLNCPVGHGGKTWVQVVNEVIELWGVGIMVSCTAHKLGAVQLQFKSMHVVQDGTCR